MNFSDFYSQRYTTASKIYNDNPRQNTGIIVVIPCYNDTFVFKTLDSLEAAKKTSCEVEVIVVVNSAEDTDCKIVENNRLIHSKLLDVVCNYHNFVLKPHIIEKVPHKIAGVGNARKIGMDEAVKRFGYLENPQGIIVSLDADCIVDADYFTEIYQNFADTNHHRKASVFQYKHNFDDSLFAEDEILACRKYEIYLRYFRLAQKVTGYPHCLHTIGSCFAVTAETYAKAGGMSKRQAGEDFYFLQKISQFTNVNIIAKPLVFPSPAISFRVPFGTGQAIAKIIKTGNCKVYDFRLFLILRKFYLLFDALNELSDDEYNNFVPKEIMNFVGEEKFAKLISDVRENTSDKRNFVKRLMANYDVFFMIRFLNEFDEMSNYPPCEIDLAATELLEYYGKSVEANLYDSIFELDVAESL